ncbi:SRSF protein kinase 3 isoform X2 [Latimeria chalumnae]|uniref:SRSF protein kinase 3 isoform X2 n=1 Tax=Latimeria chalumnae TaxID=7897 RepID=UPI0006D8F4EE|nr:PREDICTED: SRSF protein kinase 3-like isoform X2 [Latimeria chalumnae]|eukprot:XP_014350193.1 PREDICTED: SRSF protein kinase 3-like isoform X2 [Latimeria chalumnae]
MQGGIPPSASNAAAKQSQSRQQSTSPNSLCLEKALMLELEEREEQEDPAEYCPGGYHPVNVGDIFNGRYQVHCKLGWGYFSTVWLCQDRQKKRFVAVKVSKSGYGFTQTAQDELSLLRCVRGGNRKDLHDQRIVQLFDDFKLIGKNGIHVCMVFELLGHHLRHWMHRCKHQGLPIPCAKRILQQVLQGLHHLHTKCKIIHADVKPENVLLCLSKEDIGQLASNTAVWTPTASQTAKTEDLQQFDASTLNPLDPTNAGKIAVKIADLGSACWVYKHFSEEIQTRQYRALEVLLGAGYGTPADIWSTACMIMLHISSNFLVESQLKLLSLGHTPKNTSTVEVISIISRCCVSGVCMKYWWKSTTGLCRTLPSLLIFYWQCLNSDRRSVRQHWTVSSTRG